MYLVQPTGAFAPNYELDLKQNTTLDTAKDEPILSFNNETSLETDLDETITEPEETNEKVSFEEGLGLMGKGFVNKLKNMGTAVIKHPIKTLGAVAATTALVAAAPLVGISAATAGAALAVGFGAYAIGKTVVDTVETVKDNNEGRYDEVREDLEKLGGDGVDLALSLPFMPKAAKQLTRTAKYGTSTIGLNTELISNLKNCRSFGDVQLEFAKADTLINYEMIGNEMGLTVKPEVIFSKDGAGMPSYDNVSGKVDMPEKLLTLNGKKSMLKQGKNIEVEIRHELEHFKQASDIVRSEGVDALRAQMVENYRYSYQENGGSFDTTDPCFDINKRTTLYSFGKYKDQFENMLFGDGSAFNEKLYQDVIEQQGMYEAGSAQAVKVGEYQAGIMEKAEKAKELNELLQNGDKKGFMDLYFGNILEKEARAAEKVYMADVLKNRPTAINADLMAVAAAEGYFSDDDMTLKEFLNPNESLEAKTGIDSIPAVNAVVGGPTKFIVDKIIEFFN